LLSRSPDHDLNTDLKLTDRLALSKPQAPPQQPSQIIVASIMSLAQVALPEFITKYNQ